MLIFAILLILIALVAFITCSIVCGTAKKKASETKDDWERRSYVKVIKSITRVKWIATLGALVILIIVLVIGGVRVVDVTEVGVVKTFGEISGTIDSGLNFINPLTQKVTMYDLRVHVRESSFASYTKDAQPLTASIEYQYALNPAFAEDVAREYGSYEILETKLGNVIEEKAKIVFAHYSAMPLLENRSNLSTEVAEEVKTIEDLFHVTFTSVVVKDIDFSDAFEASVEAKMTAEQAGLNRIKRLLLSRLSRRRKSPQSLLRPLLRRLRVKQKLWKLLVRLCRICPILGFSSSGSRSGTASCLPHRRVQTPQLL